MLRLELIFLHSSNGAGCFRWRDEDCTYLQSEHDPRPKVCRSEGQCRRVILRAAGRSPPPIQQCRLSEVPHYLVRVECLRCFRVVEIQKADAVRFYGPHAVWKDVAQRLLDQTCTNRAGRREEDGCWPAPAE